MPVQESPAGDSSCPVHGDVTPVQAFGTPNTESTRAYAGESRLPIWLPWPLPHAWIVSGIGHAGRGFAAARATVLACSGPNPVGGQADLLVVTEEPGVGLGARYAGLAATDPGAEVGRGVAHVKPEVDGHLTPMWCVRGAAGNRAVYAGEADGRWLWLILHPESAGALLMEPLSLVDLRDLGAEIELLPFGPVCQRLLD
jgi:hypothetical protein